MTASTTLKLSGILALRKNPFAFFEKTYDSSRPGPQTHLFFLLSIYNPLRQITLNANSTFTLNGTSFVKTLHADHDRHRQI